LNNEITHSFLSKHHTALYLHQVYEAIAANVVNIFLANGKEKPADIDIKYWVYPRIGNMLQPICFNLGDTRELYKDNNFAKSGQD
jgi:hypothetical protein